MLIHNDFSIDESLSVSNEYRYLKIGRSYRKVGNYNNVALDLFYNILIEWSMLLGGPFVIQGGAELPAQNFDAINQGDWRNSGARII